RVAKDFPTFAEFCETAAVADGRDGMVWERVASVAETDYDGTVYDFTVTHDDHNFIADGFVVSNCGVRLVRSNLFYREVKPHLRELVDSLFRTIPTGAGRSGRYSFRGKDLDRLLAEGSRYVVERGLGDPRDVEYAEAHGRLDGADPDLVSDHAKQ